MRAVALFVLASSLVLGTSARASERQLDAHQHGHGTLNLALEGPTLLIELEAPGADIVGFEHPAKSAEDRAAIESAKGRLKNPLALFALDAEAGCVVESADVELIGDHEEAHHEDEHHEDEHHEDEHHEDEHHEEGHDEDMHGEEGHDEAHGGETHTEFHAEYRLTCAAPGRIDQITFPYFDLFPGAEELDVNAITADGQSRHEVDRVSPVLRLKGN